MEKTNLIKFIAFGFMCVVLFLGFFITDKYTEVRILESQQNCWNVSFIPPYVYLRTNTCTGEWSEEVSKTGKLLYNKMQLQLEKKKKML